jgi:hydroxymethylpyrimidine/phosphomethylpyrimidine kinase
MHHPEAGVFSYAEINRYCMTGTPARQRSDVLDELSVATGRIVSSLDPGLVPVGGAHFGYAITGARDAGGVAAIRGGIVIADGKVCAAGECAFGGDESISRIILTAMRFDPQVRSAAIVRFTPEMRDLLDDSLMECCSFDPVRTPSGVSTMDWGVASCCKDGVPDAVYDARTQNNEPLISFLGETPADVANNIIMISNRIIRIEL